MEASRATRIYRLYVALCVSYYLASHAAAVPFNYSRCGPALVRHDMSFADNTTRGGRILGVSPLALLHGLSITRHVTLTATDHVDSSTDDSLTLIERAQLSNWSADMLSPIFPLSEEQLRVLAIELSKFTFDACSASPVGSLESQGCVYTRRGRIVDYTLFLPRRGCWSSNSRLYPPTIEPARMRKLLPGEYGRGRGHVPSSWLKQVSVVASALLGLICAMAGLVLCCNRSKRSRQSTAAIQLEDDHEPTIREPQLRQGLGPRQFRYCQLAAATENFAEERKIGRGGFGPVYRGYLSEEDRHVAIKVLSQELSVQGLKEFQAEITILSQLRHRNIVRLVGWCGRRRELMLVYELVPGGSLDDHLYNHDRHLTWPERYKIAIQLGSALRYLHTECDQCVVHGDIKPANVMLDASGNAKLGDFGLARLVDHGVEPQTTQVIAGTVGYIDPEFVSSRRPSAESDVYSFGVVLLEIACGRRPTPSRRPGQAASAALLASVRDMYRRDVILDAADRRLDGEFDRVQMERLLVTGLWCAQQDPVQRPSVAQVVDVLRSEDAELPVLGTMGGSDEEISALEGQAYGDLSAQSSVYLDESNETTYLTTEDSAYLLQM